MPEMPCRHMKDSKNKVNNLTYLFNFNNNNFAGMKPLEICQNNVKKLSKVKRIIKWQR